jgi:hypothetical protein
MINDRTVIVIRLVDHLEIAVKGAVILNYNSVFRNFSGTSI